MIDQKYHTTLIQAFDPVRFRTDRTGEAERTMEARTEVLLNLLFGREVVLPAGHIADSPAVATVYREVLAAYDRLSQHKKRVIRRKPFRIALEAAYTDYSDYVGQYQDVGAPTVSLPIDEQRAQMERAKALAYVKQLYLDRKYGELEKVTARPGFADYARLVTDYLGADAVCRPAGTAVVPDLVAVVRQRLKQIPDEFRQAYHDEIESALPFFAETEGCRTFRGLWYAHAPRLGEHWELVRNWLDQALYFNLWQSYAVEHPVLMTQPFTGRRYRDEDVLIPQLYDGPVNVEPVRVAKVDWDIIWSIMAEEKFQVSLARLTSDLDRETYGNRPRDALFDHAELINTSLDNVRLNLTTGQIELAAKERNIPGEIVASTLAGATVVMLGAFVPLPDPLGHELLKYAAGTLATGATMALVARESKWFAQRQNDKLVPSNKATVTAALNHMAAVTKISSRHVQVLG